MTLNHRIGQQIRKARKLAHLTQKQLGDKLGRSGATIAYLEQGKRRVSPNLLEEVAQYTNKPLSFFYESEENQSSDLGQQIRSLKEQLGEVNSVLSRAEQKCQQTASQLKLSEEKFRLIFEEASDAMILMDAEGRILDINQAYEALLELRKEQAEGQLFWEVPIGSPEESALFQKAFVNTMHTGEVLEHVRFPITTHSGSVITVESTARLLKRNGKIWAMLCILRPVREAQHLSELVSV